MKQIANAYISVELQDAKLNWLCQALRDQLETNGVNCDLASEQPHVSIAYGEGEAEWNEVVEAAEEIAELPFSLKVSSFSILQGQATPFDYLVIELEGAACFQAAVRTAQDHMKTKSFGGSFCCHVSLVRFAKGTLSSEVAEKLVRELNASQSAAFALGRSPCVRGGAVSVYGSDRKCCLKVPFQEERRSSFVA